MLNKLFDWFENRINPYPEDIPNTPPAKVISFIFESIKGMRSYFVAFDTRTKYELLSGPG
ncbi:hypothetical protein KZ388_08940 [Glaesserella parasuis]|nr:hypothetical protein [Glaesserella parasuis]MCT8744753.1 hypothetical protein [Glaesserella parasuis]